MNVIAGLHDVRLALEGDAGNLTEIWIDERRRDKRMNLITHLAEKRGVKLHRVDKQELERLAAGLRHQGVVASCRTQAARQENTLAQLVQACEHPPLVLILDGIQDPHNLGACLRSADGAGVDAVIAPADKACGITPVVSKVAAGAAHSVPFFAVSNLSRSMEELKQLGLWIVGASDDGLETLWQSELDGPCALVLGAEGKGMRPLTRKQCDFLVRIPMLGAVESLNVSVATGVLLYEARRQRGI